MSGDVAVSDPARSHFHDHENVPHPKLAVTPTKKSQASRPWNDHFEESIGPPCIKPVGYSSA
jgi:hypothetical protein